MSPEWGIKPKKDPLGDIKSGCSLGQLTREEKELVIVLKALKTVNRRSNEGQGCRHIPCSGWVHGLSGPPESRINTVIITLTQAGCGTGKPNPGVGSGGTKSCLAPALSGDEQLLWTLISCLKAHLSQTGVRTKRKTAGQLVLFLLLLPLEELHIIKQSELSFLLSKMPNSDGKENQSANLWIKLYYVSFYSWLWSFLL